MPARAGLPIAAAPLLGGLLLAGIVVPAMVWEKQGEGFRQKFEVDTRALINDGESSYWSLVPGTVLTLKGGTTTLVVTVTDKTELVDGVVTRVVEERETEKGELIEISRNFFARNAATGDVYYFGESVDMYKNGKVTSHDGSWRSGESGAHFGLFVPGKPARGDKYYQEIAPKVAMDRAEITSITDSVRTGAGTFGSCIRTRETTPLEPGVVEWKRYCPGVGIVEDGELKLASLRRRK
jgi:hypothetical protein